MSAAQAPDGGSGGAQLPPNAARRWGRYGRMLIVVGCGLGVWPVLGLTGRPAVFAGVLTTGIIVAAMGLIVALVSGMRARIFDAVVAGDRHLASWTCSPELWERFVAGYRERQARGTWRNMRWAIMALLLLALILGQVLPGTTGQAAGWMLFGTAAVLSAVFYLVGVVPYRQLQGGSRTIFLGLDGVVICGALHAWRESGARLELAEYWSGADGDAEVRLGYSTQSQYGPVQHRVAFPVPPEYREQAERHVATLAAQVTARGVGRPPVWGGRGPGRRRGGPRA